MPTKTSTRRTSATNGRHSAEAAIERVNQSLEVAQKALKAIGGDVSRGTRDMAADIERMIAATRKDARKLTRAVRADLTKLQKDLASSAPRRPGARAARPRTSTHRKAGAGKA